LSDAPAVLVGTAGWSLPRTAQDAFPGAGTHLERYAAVLPAVEINSTFYRPHRHATFARWAHAVPADFRFSVKVPKAITHERRLADCVPLLGQFLAQIEPLGPKLACLLVQLPPSGEFDARVAPAFLEALRERFDRDVVLEPRHATWFTPGVESLLVRLRIARVAADRPRGDAVLEPGGWRGVAYFRLHGSPRMYFSSYDDVFLDTLAQRLRALADGGTRCWCIFDNTTLGAAVPNALALLRQLREMNSWSR
jgi:uncharacterized protein YecE (DUF72 family)